MMEWHVNNNQSLHFWKAEKLLFFATLKILAFNHNHINQRNGKYFIFI